jgi:phosphosulfolactate phosphohydrolase-like enzyme
MRHTSLDSKVNVIIDGKTQQGTIVDVLSQGAARIQLGDNSSVQASHSISGKDGTFHYLDEADAVKAAKAESTKPAPQPTAVPANKPAAN